jgi:hypothetical protein
MRPVELCEFGEFGMSWLRFFRCVALAAVWPLFFVLPVQAGDLFVLVPAEPQPAASALKPGLAVKYAYGSVEWLEGAEGWRGSAKLGKPLEGFVYGDTNGVDRALTSGSNIEVIAFIDGYLHFKAGVHELEFQSNDGLRVTLAGIDVYTHDGKHACESIGAIQVKAPKTGWYVLRALYFQKKGTACLDLSMREPGGEWDWTAPEMYGHIPQ